MKGNLYPSQNPFQPAAHNKLHWEMKDGNDRACLYNLPRQHGLYANEIIKLL
jgi:hypothetical protein